MSNTVKFTFTMTLASILVACGGKPDNLTVLRNDSRVATDVACFSKFAKCPKTILPGQSKMIVNAKRIYIAQGNNLYMVSLPKRGVFKIDLSKIGIQDKPIDEQKQCKAVKKNELITRIACDAKELKTLN